MITARTVPWFTVSTGIETTPWRILHDGDDRLLGKELETWDPGTDLDIVRSLTVDIDATRDSARLPADVPLVLVATWHCEGTTLRGSGARAPLAGSGTLQLELGMRISGRLVGGDVWLRTTLAPSRPVMPSPLRPRRPGSILWEDEHKLALEGGGSRFPMEVRSFAKAGWHLPDRAAWALEWEPAELDLPVLGGLRLVLNADHPAMAQALEVRNAPAARMLFAAMQMDVGRQLLMGALATSAFVEREDPWPKGSVGDVIARLQRLIFKGESPRALRARWQQEPERFEVQLQAALAVFEVES